MARFGCKFCGKWFTNPRSYGGHINHHKGDKDPSITCECNKKFDSVIKYRSHIGRCSAMMAKRAEKTEEKVVKVKKVKKAKAKPKDTKKYIVVFYDDEIRVIGSMKEVKDSLRIDADMNEIPDDENDIKIYEIAREIKAEYDRQVKVNILT